MSRLRQLRPYEYGSSTAVQTEFESIVRYLQSAEVGGQTLAETLAKLTDDNGNLASNVQLRNNGANGIEYRVGEYTDANAGWATIVSAADLRGPSGAAIGEIGAPIFNSRVDYTVVNTLSDPVDTTELLVGATTLNYAHLDSDELLVYRDGILLTPTTEYTTDPNGNGGTGTITLTQNFLTSFPTQISTNFSVYKVRSTTVTNFRRLNATNETGSPQAFISFDLDNTTEIMVFVGGVLYREPDDYTRDVANDRINLAIGQEIQPNTNYTVITVENADVQTVSGIMMESAFADNTTGLIRFDKVGIEPGQITQDKVASLTADLDQRAKFFDNPSTTDLQAGTVNDSFYKRTVNNATEVVFYDGTNSIVLNPSTSLPSASATDVNKFVQVDSNGGYTLGNVDFSGYLDTDDKGASNGVAALDSSAKLLFSQYDFGGTENGLLNGFHAGPQLELYYNPMQTFGGTTPAVITDGYYRIERVIGQHFNVIGVEARCAGGQCDIQFAVNQVGIGNSVNVAVPGNPPNLFTSLNGINVDARGTTSIEIGVIVSNAANNLTGLELVFKTALVENS